MTQRVTLKAISERCGVSHVAVGAALGTHSSKSQVRLSPEKAKEIQRVAQEMGYQENKLAQALRTRRTHTVGVLFRVLTNPQPVNYLIDCLHRELQHRDYSAHLWPFHSRFDLLERGIRDLAGWQVDGLLISHLFGEDDGDSQWPALENWLDQINLPVVMTESTLRPNRPWTMLNVDLPGAAASATRYLAGLGHRHLAFICPEPTRGMDRRRLAAARDAVPGLIVDNLQLATRKASRPTLELVETAMELGSQLAARRDRPTGYICANDVIASALCTSFQENGVQVPGQVSIVGFDNAEAAMLCSPMLTTFEPPMEQLARQAVDCLLHTIDGEGMTPDRSSIEATFIQRGSTGKA